MVKAAFRPNFAGHLLGPEGGPGPDTVTGGSGDDTLNGFGGADVLNGQEGNDALFGGSGNDTLFVVAGLDADTVYGGAGDDEVILAASGFNHLLHGGAGDDLLSVSADPGAPVVMRGNLATGLALRVGGVLVATMDGIDRLNVTGGTGNDILIGGAGNDQLQALTGRDVIAAGSGDDGISFGLSLSDRVDAGAGNDTVTVGIGRDLGLFGAGSSVVVGGEGDDQLIFAGFQTAYVFDGTTQFANGVKVADYSGFERLVMPGSVFADSVTGFSGNDILSGGDGNDQLFGSGGDDSLNGSYGDDLLDGGDGNDLFAVAQGVDTEFGGAGDDVFGIVLNNDGLPNVGDFISGGTGHDTAKVDMSVANLSQPLLMTGDLQTGAMLTMGGVVQAQFDGIESLSIVGSNNGVGSDSLIGGTGSDTIWGLSGDDTISTGDGDDVVLESVIQFDFFNIDLGSGIDTIMLVCKAESSASMILSDVMQVKVKAVVTGTVTGAEIADFTGNIYNNLLVGGDYQDKLRDTEGGLDTLLGRGGDDDIVVGAVDWARKLVAGNLGTDTLYYSGYGARTALEMSIAANGAIIVSGADRALLTALTVEHLDFQGGTYADLLIGLSGADTLRGDAGNDTLNGMSGDDVIDSGPGLDRVKGGAGADAFNFYDHGAGNMTTIIDFSAEDIVYQHIFDGSPDLIQGSDPVPVSTGRRAATFLYDTDTGVLSADADGAGAGAAVVFATLLNNGVAATLTEAQIEILF